MFTRKVLSDCEGAVACQLFFQSLYQTQAGDTYVEPLLNLTRQRMQDDPTPIELKKHLLGIFMASMYYSAPLTLQYLEAQNMTSQLVEEMCNIRTSFSAEYERRFFIVGLSRMLLCQQLPASLQPQLLRLLNEIVEAISQLHDQVTKKVKAQANKEARDDSDDESEDEEDDDISDEGDAEESKKKGKGTKTNTNMDEDNGESSVTPAADTNTMDDDQLGFVESAAKGNDDDDDDPSEDPNDNADDDASDDDDEDVEFVS